jgi:hypothetical protein
MTTPGKARTMERTPATPPVHGAPPDDISVPFLGHLALCLPRLHPLPLPSLAPTSLPSENPADSSLLSDTSIADRYLQEDREAILPQPSLAAGILKPPSAPGGVIQDTCLNDTHKGREAFSEVESYLCI